MRPSVITSNIADEDKPLEVYVSVKEGELVKIEDIDAATGNIDLAIYPNKEEAKKDDKDDDGIVDEPKTKDDNVAPGRSDNGYDTGASGWDDDKYNKGGIPKLGEIITEYGGLILASCAVIALVVSFIIAAVKRRKEDDEE